MICIFFFAWGIGRRSQFSPTRLRIEAGPTLHPQAARGKLLYAALRWRTDQQPGAVAPEGMEPRSGGYQPKAATVAPKPWGLKEEVQSCSATMNPGKVRMQCKWTRTRVALITMTN
eukprot:Gb_08097 [translate_table: standard]